MDRSVRRVFKDRYEEHWYFAARTSVLGAFIDRFCPTRAGTTVGDLGAGTGAVLARVADSAVGVAVEREPDLAGVGVKRYGLRYVVASLGDGIPLRRSTFDMILMLDVLEHLLDDGRVLAEACQVVRPGGRVLLTVPAFQGLWSSHDELHHHHRRYAKRQLVDMVAGTGLVVERVTYFNTLLFPLIAASRLLERLSLRRAEVDGRTDYDRTPRPLTGALEWIFKQERHLVRHWRLPIGVSLMVLARRPGHTVGG